MQEQVLNMEALLCIRLSSSLAQTWEPLRVSCCIWHHLGGNPLSSVVCEAGPPWISTSHRCLIGLGSGESGGHMDTFSSPCSCAVFVVLHGALWLPSGSAIAIGGVRGLQWCLYVALLFLLTLIWQISISTLINYHYQINENDQKVNHH